jgi:predicted dehydrogenase
MAMVLEFRRSILENSEPAITGEEGLNDLDLVLRVYESAESGLPVELNSV